MSNPLSVQTLNTGPQKSTGASGQTPQSGADESAGKGFQQFLRISLDAALPATRLADGGGPALDGKGLKLGRGKAAANPGGSGLPPDAQAAPWLAAMLPATLVSSRPPQGQRPDMLQKASTATQALSIHLDGVRMPADGAATDPRAAAAPLPAAETAPAFTAVLALDAQKRHAPALQGGDGMGNAPAPASTSAGMPPLALPLLQQSEPQMTAAAAPLSAPLGSPDWQQGLGQQILWMAHKHEQQASLQLNPPHLGPLEVHLQIKDGQASALFVSPHGAVREAIEAAMPRLRDSLQEQGLILNGSCQSAYPDSQPGYREQPRGNPGRSGSTPALMSVGEAAPVSETGAGVLRPLRRGLVNLFA